jgi:hypothetical protein
VISPPAKALLIGALTIGALPRADAYDAETHAFVMYKAYQESQLALTDPASLSVRLGLNRLDPPTPFNAYWQSSGSDVGPLAYYDNTATFDPATYARAPNEYERCQMQVVASVPLVTNSLGTGWFDPLDPMLDGTDVAYFPVQNWLMRGVLREDDVTPLLYKTIARSTCKQPDVDPYLVGGQGVRVLNHFYDPIHDIALGAGVGCAVAPTGACLKSVDWALGYADSFATPQVVNASRRNHFTYVDARENLWRALTGERGFGSPPYTSAKRADDAQERLYRWATTFRSLGDVIHMLQDGASPQHVRNDPHSAFNSPEAQAFEPFTNARVLLQSVRTTKSSYVRGFFSRTTKESVPDVVYGNVPYPIPVFATPLRYFTTRVQGDVPASSPDSRLGLMDYANRSFFTAGTTPKSGYAFLRPPVPISSANGYTQSDVSCNLSSDIGHIGRMDLKCTHWTHAVVDSIVPGYVDQLPVDGNNVAFTAPPLVAESAFRFAKDAFGGLTTVPEFTIGLAELQNMGNLGVPRAIGYSAGLIDYFFRGKLEIVAPTDQIVAVLNQGAPHTMNAQGYPCAGTTTTDGCANFGFEKVRLKVRNDTAAIIETGTTTPVPQATGGSSSQLVAVAKYHRSSCYKPDLSGERVQVLAGTITPPTCSGGSTVRTAYQEVSVSAVLTLTAGELDGLTPGTGVEKVFDFTADPIPVNATDLFIQVVYRGKLGQEADGIAVGMVDVSEPTLYRIGIIQIITGIRCG